MGPDYIIDASALYEVLATGQPDDGLVKRVEVGRAAAPDVIDLEVVATLRKHLRRGLIDARHADVVFGALRDFPLVRIPHRLMLSRIWRLRDGLGVYDAAYVATSEVYEIPLVTCDGRLGRAHAHSASIEVYPV